jgi:hypothetical protein
MPLSAEEFAAQFQAAERSLLRLEMRRHTDVVEERPQLRAFLAGELPEVCEREPNWFSEMVGRHAAAGRPFRRVRVMDDPLTDYNRFMIWGGRSNVANGEDIRYLAMAEANKLDLPDHDFWVFDSARLVELRFTDDGRPLEHDLITDLDTVARHEEWINRAFAAATPSVDYVAEDPTRAWPPIRLGAAKGT